jgi:uncharacterized RDD family membrane protein YckC
MASIEIQTTQNVTIEYELATLRDRFFAFFIDLLIFYGIYIFLWFFLMAVLGDAITGWGGHFLGLMQLVGLLAYHLLSEVFANGQSWGKKAMNIKVVRLDGREPGLGDYLLRSVFLLVDFVFSLGVLGAILIGSTFKSQRMGDLAANTTVIRMKNQLHFRLHDILKINTLDNYEPQYPAVRQLSEADMLLIKNLLAHYQTWRNAAHAEAVSDAALKICRELNIEQPPRNKIEFLKTLIRDYIVLTR